MICIVPARKNSKTLRNKNIKKLDGIPLIKHTVNVAKKSKYIKKIYLSTDDNRIINMFKDDKFVQIPFVRPKNLSGDKVNSVKVYLHMLKFLEKKVKINNFCVLLPTCPIRDVRQIDKAISIFKKSKNIKFLISVAQTEPLEFQFKLNKKNFMEKVRGNKFSISNRQKLDKIYYPNGSIYIFDKHEFKKSKTFMSSKTYCYVMNKYFSQDIDTITDFKIAQKLIN